MLPYLAQVPWMPSPPLAPDQSAIDVAHLRRMTLGEPDLEREVLTMFKTQSGQMLTRLVVLPPDAAELAHTLKGSARAIGAFAVGDAAHALESALRQQSGIADAVRVLTSAVADARSAVDTLLGEIHR
jgi:HPt (histidine-containing phosphotransfer) domain-containing protein